MSIKYYSLAKDEELPEEFCVVRDMGGEPGEYVFYVPEAENAKLRELVRDMYRRFHGVVIENWSYSSEDFYTYEQRMRELGVEVP